MGQVKGLRSQLKKVLGVSGGKRERAEGGEEHLVPGQGKWRRRARLCTIVCLSQYLLSSCYTSNNLGQTVFFFHSPTQPLVTSLVAVSMRKDFHAPEKPALN